MAVAVVMAVVVAVGFIGFGFTVCTVREILWSLVSWDYPVCL